MGSHAVHQGPVSRLQAIRDSSTSKVSKSPSARTEFLELNSSDGHDDDNDDGVVDEDPRRLKFVSKSHASGSGTHCVGAADWPSPTMLDFHVTILAFPGPTISLLILAHPRSLSPQDPQSEVLTCSGVLDYTGSCRVACQSLGYVYKETIEL